MPCQLRTPDEPNPLPPNAGSTRMQKLQDLVCGGPWNAHNDICLIYWRPKPGGGGEWVAWTDSPAPRKDPLPEADVTIS